MRHIGGAKRDRLFCATEILAILEESTRLEADQSYVLEAVQEGGGGFALEMEEHPAGAAHYAAHGRSMSEETLAACRSADAILKGPVGDPAVRTPEGTEAGLLGGVLRGRLDLFANVRPIKLYPGAPCPLKGYEAGRIDYVVMRENTEGLYASRDKGVGGENAVADTMLMTRPGVERIVRAAFEISRRRGSTTTVCGSRRSKIWTMAATASS